MKLEKIILDYYKEVLLYVISLCKNYDIAEDITQETFFKAMKSIEGFDGSQHVRAWLFTIAKNTYFTYYKRQKNDAGDELLDYIEDDKTSLVEQLLNEEQALTIHKFLHEMEEPYKEIFNLRVFGELSFEKIASIFGKNPNWARVTFYRAKKKIIEHMEGNNHE